MNFERSVIEGGWIIKNTRHKDNRGWFSEWFKKSTFESELGISFNPIQLNISHSLQGVIRGIHYSIAEKGQAKFVTVMSGEVDDYIIDIRPGSPTFGKWQRVRLSSKDGESVLLGSNLAHAFQCVSVEATVCYAVTAEFDSEMEKGINPFDPTLNIAWNDVSENLMSSKDIAAPFLEEQIVQDLLPRF
jgi:dTDP-4-dehydrorhamnose 3,5-epimerase